MDPKRVWIPGTRLGHMAEKLACNKSLMNVSVPRQCLGRGATATEGYQSVGPISKYKGEWQPTARYLLYQPKKKSEYGHHLVFMSKNGVHGQVGQLQPGTPGAGQHMEEREQKSENFRAQYPERYTRDSNTEVHSTIVGMIQNYNKKFSKLCISNVCKLEGVKIYRLLSVKGFDGEN